MLLRKITLSLFGLFSLWQSATAAPTVIGSIPGLTYVNGMAVKDNYLYLANATAGLKIYDITNKVTPSLVGSYDTDGNAANIQVIGNVAYLADGASGLKIFDVSTPASPVLLGSFDTSYASTLVVDGNYAYVVDGSDGLRILDISTPSNIVQVGQYDTAVYARDVEVVGNRAYVADNQGGLVVLNITSVTNPTPVTIYQPDNNLTASVVVQNDLAYVTVATDDLPQLRILDLSDEQNIYQTGSVDFNGIAGRIIVENNIAYLRSYFTGATFVDVLNPANPYLIGNISSSSKTSSILKDGDYFYMGESDQVEIVDITDLTSPVVLNTVTSPGSSYQAVSKGDYTYIAKGTSGIHIIDSSDPANPTEITTYNVSGNYIRDVDVSDDGNYLFAISSDNLYVIDVTNKTAPSLIGTHPKPVSGTLSSVKQRTIYTSYTSSTDYGIEKLVLVTDFYAGVHIYSYVTPNALTHTKTVSIPNPVNNFTFSPHNCELVQKIDPIANGYSISTAIYVAASQGGFYVIYLNEAATVDATVSYAGDANWNGGTAASDVTILKNQSNTYDIYFAAESGGVKKYETTNTLFYPVFSSTIDTEGLALDVENFNNTHLVVADQEEGVFIFEALNPTNNYTLQTDSIFQNSAYMSVNQDKNISVSIEGRAGYGDAYFIDLKSLLP